MQSLDSQIVRVTTALAGLVALFVATMVPLSHYFREYRGYTAHMDVQAAFLGSAVSQIASREPSFWRFETQRLLALLPDDRDEGFPDLHRVLDGNGGVVVEKPDATTVLLARPLLVRSMPVYDSGRIVGRIEIARSLKPLIIETAIAACFAAIVALGIFIVFRHLPLRALRHALERVSYLASHDALTGLPNRALFHDRLEQAIEHSRRSGETSSVVCLDLDHFKDINDTLGHGAGDQLLQQATSRLRHCLRKTDTLARLGGDEFAVIQFGLRRPEDAATLAQRVLEAVAAPFHLNGEEMIVGASLGIAVFTGRGNADQILCQADMAMYRAKTEGRGTYRFFEEQMNERLHARKALEHDLRRAVADGQFELYYQPQIEMATDRVIGVEALVRWHHPQRGMVPPGDFISLAEDTGLIIPLGEWVLRSACQQTAAWRALRVSVNLSPVQFRLPGLAVLVARVLAETRFEANRLELEITEGVLLHDTEATLTTLNALKTIGVRIAMDDFGTGYSSLSYLRRFPFDKIKIDRSFIRDLGRGDDSAAIVRAIIALGDSLGMITNAEGVETELQATRLRQEGCKEAQGYLYAAPMPIADLSRFIARRYEQVGAREVVQFRR